MFPILTLHCLQMIPIYIFLITTLKFYICGNKCINYKKAAICLLVKKRTKMTNFRLYINHYPIELKKSIKYLRIHLDRELSWKNQIDYLAEKLSKVSRNDPYIAPLRSLTNSSNSLL